MPTKPNKAGQQQNYVPAGNGDASGEYSDNESGSNIHFTNFKKPEEKPKVETVEKPIDKTPKEEITLENGKIEETTPTKKLTKKEKAIQESQDKFKSIFPECKVNFSGYDDEARANINDTVEKITNDFPNLKKYLKEFGNPNAMNKEDSQKIIQQRLAEITPESIEKRRQDIIRWNIGYGNNTKESLEQHFTPEYVKQLMIQEANQKVRTGRASIGKSCAVTAYSLGSPKSSCYFKEKYIGKGFEQIAQSNFDSNWWSSNDKNQCVSHEMGHAIDNYLFGIMQEKQLYTRGYRRQIVEIYERESANIQKKLDEVAKEQGIPNGLSGYKSLDIHYAQMVLKNKGEKLFALSQYGMTNTSEFIAECVAAHYGNQKNPVAEEVFNILRNAEKDLTTATVENL